MAEINKLSVEKVLNKLRSNDAQKRTREMQLEEKADTLDEELRRLRQPRSDDCRCFRFPIPEPHQRVHPDAPALALVDGNRVKRARLWSRPRILSRG